MIKKDWDGYGAKYETKFRIFLRIMLSGGQKHHFLQDSVHISKFCSSIPDSAKNSAGAESQHPGGTEYHVLNIMLFKPHVTVFFWPSKHFF